MRMSIRVSKRKDPLQDLKLSTMELFADIAKELDDTEPLGPKMNDTLASIIDIRFTSTLTSEKVKDLQANGLHQKKIV